MEPLILLLALVVSTARASDAPKNGADIYATMCAVCHGSAGEGYKADRAPALANPDLLASASDYFLRLATAEGRPGTTMSAWDVERGGPLYPDDLDALVAYMRAWGKQPPAQLDERPSSGSAERGAALYSAQCAKCHGQKGVGGSALQIGSAQFLRGAGNGFLRRVIGHGLGGTAMPGFETAIGKSGIEDLLSLLRGWLSAAPAKPTARTYAAPVPLGPVPLNPKGPEPEGFRAYPANTPVDIVKAQLDCGARFALLDARVPSDYSNEHITGAVSVPFYDPEPYEPALPKNAWLVAYCACPHAESGQLAKKLSAAGFPKVTVLDEGFGVWKSRKYGTKSGREP